jgi:hypothetical protein
VSDVWARIPLPPPHERLMPPDRYPVPASALPMLEPPTLVTWGDPGSWWLVDAAFVSEYPTRDAETSAEEYRLLPLANDQPFTLPADRLWVYQDVPGQEGRQAIDLEPWHPSAWTQRILDDDLTPPPLRRPRPARELPSLTGRVVRYLNQGSVWDWGVAVSEPLRRDDGYVARMVTFDSWTELLTGNPPIPPEPWTHLVHALWAY